MIYLLVAIGGGIGALLRFISVNFIHSTCSNFVFISPIIGTLGVNALGSFLIGVFSQLIISIWGTNPELKLLLITGFLGGFTTFSSFSLETVTDLVDGNYLRAGLNVTISLLSCLVATFGGMQLVLTFK